MTLVTAILLIVVGILINKRYFGRDDVGFGPLCFVLAGFMIAFLWLDIAIHMPNYWDKTTNDLR